MTNAMAVRIIEIEGGGQSKLFNEVGWSNTKNIG